MGRFTGAALVTPADGHSPLHESLVSDGVAVDTALPVEVLIDLAITVIVLLIADLILRRHVRNTGSLSLQTLKNPRCAEIRLTRVTDSLDKALVDGLITVVIDAITVRVVSLTWPLGVARSTVIPVGDAVTVVVGIAGVAHPV